MKLSDSETGLPALQAHRSGGRAQMPSSEAQNKGLLSVVALLGLPENLPGLSNIKVPRNQYLCSSHQTRSQQHQ